MCVRLNVLSRIQGNITVTSAPPPLRSTYCAHRRDRGLRGRAPGRSALSAFCEGRWVQLDARRLPWANEGRRHPSPGRTRPKLLGYSVGAPRWLKCRLRRDSSIVFARATKLGDPRASHFFGTESLCFGRFTTGRCGRGHV